MMHAWGAVDLRIYLANKKSWLLNISPELWLLSLPDTTWYPWFHTVLYTEPSIYLGRSIQNSWCILGGPIRKLFRNRGLLQGIPSWLCPREIPRSSPVSPWKTHPSLRDSKTCGRTTAQKFSDFAQNLEICMCKLFFFYFYLVFTVFSSLFTHIKWFLVIFFHFFLRKIWKIQFWPRKKIYF